MAVYILRMALRDSSSNHQDLPRQSEGRERGRTMAPDNFGLVYEDFGIVRYQYAVENTQELLSAAAGPAAGLISALAARLDLQRTELCLELGLLGRVWRQSVA